MGRSRILWEKQLAPTSCDLGLCVHLPEVGVTSNRAGLVFVAYTLLMLVGCGTPAPKVPHEQPLLDLRVLRTLEPMFELSEKTSPPLLDQGYLINMEEPALERELAADPTIAFRTKLIRTEHGCIANYVVGGRKVSVYLTTGMGDAAVPAGQCRLVLSGPPGSQGR